LFKLIQSYSADSPSWDVAGLLGRTDNYCTLCLILLSHNTVQSAFCHREISGKLVWQTQCLYHPANSL